MLSSIGKFKRSTIRKVYPPLIPITIIFKKYKLGSNRPTITKPIPKEAKKPAKYPIIVFSEVLGKFILPNLSPNKDAAPSPIVAIKIAAANTQNGKKKIGTNERTNTVGLMNSKFS